MKAGEVAEKLTSLYKLENLPDKISALTEEQVHRLVDIFSESMFTYAQDETIKLRAKHSKTHQTYFYYFTFPGTHTLANFANDGSYRKPPFDALT